MGSLVDGDGVSGVWCEVLMAGSGAPPLAAVSVWGPAGGGAPTLEDSVE